MALVCLCHGVNERRVAREIERGACTIAEVGEACGAGTCCMGCHSTIDEMLATRTATSVAGVGVRLNLA